MLINCSWTGGARKWSDWQSPLKKHELGPIVISHAGVTRSNWRSVGAKSASATVKSINKLVGSDLGKTSKPGKLVNEQVNRGSDVLWAEVNQELYSSWIGHDVPFSQIHGHAAPWNWATNSFWPDTPSSVRQRCLIDYENRRTVTWLGKKRTKKSDGPVAISVDWKLGTKEWPRIWRILMLDAKITVR